MHISNDDLRLLVTNYWRKSPQYFSMFEWLAKELTALIDLENADQERLMQLIEELEEMDDDVKDYNGDPRVISATVTTLEDQLNEVLGTKK